MLTIELKQLRFFGYHGLYAEEKKTGNEFSADIFISYDPGQTIISDIGATVNYATVYELTKKRMAEPVALLETLAMQLAEDIHAAFPFIKKTVIHLSKLTAPISQLTGTVGVRFERNY